jgi:TonB family protein
MKHLITAILFFIGTVESAIAQKDPLNHEMVFVEGGTFQMGSETGEADERPVHSVTLSSFKIGKFEVTQAQWKAVMGNNPSDFKGCDDCPVETVSWYDVHDFILKLNAKTGMNYRLPTEAEWEYAARGGKSSKGYTYSGSNDLNAVAWNRENSGSKTHSVGGNHANELGVCDMTGNVWEWCSDWYGLYNSYSETNPTGASSGQYRVLRGGSWYYSAISCHTAFRNRFFPGLSNYDYGFRLVLPAEDETSGEKVTQPIENATPKEENKNDLPVIADDAIAEYPGGEAAMYKFFSDNLLYPEDAVENGIEGKVYLRFVVDVDGTAKDFTVMKSVPGGQSLEQAAIEVCKKFPKFNPPIRDGKPIKTYFVLPINFQL